MLQSTHRPSTLTAKKYHAIGGAWIGAARQRMGTVSGSDFAVGVAWACALLFAVSSTHKATMLARGSASGDPVVASMAPDARAPFVLAGAAAVELGVLGLLLLERSAGLVIAAVIIAAYALLMRRIDPETPCHCFSGSSATRAGSASVRNVILGAACAAAAICSLTLDPAHETSAAAGVAIATLAVVAAFEALSRFAAGVQAGAVR